MRALAVLFVFIASGCAQKIPIEYEQPHLTVVNRTHQNIASLEVKPCRQDSSNFRSVAKNLKVGKSYRYTAKDTCIDVRAVSYQGKIIGVQNKLILPPRIRWVIK